MNTLIETKVYRYNDVRYRIELLSGPSNGYFAYVSHASGWVAETPLKSHAARAEDAAQTLAHQHYKENFK